jgi:hypothetical protein
MRRYKSLFRYWTLKQLENAKQYKKSSKQYSFDTSNVTKTLKFPKRLLRMSEIIMECDEQEGLQTPPAFNEFEVLGRAQQKDIEDEVVSQGSNKVKVSIEFANFILVVHEYFKTYESKRVVELKFMGYNVGLQCMA